MRGGPAPGGGGRVRKELKKCHVLFEWPLMGMLLLEKNQVKSLLKRKKYLGALETSSRPGVANLFCPPAVSKYFWALQTTLFNKQTSKVHFKINNSYCRMKKITSTVV